MTTKEIHPGPAGTVGPSSYDEWRDRRWRLTGALLGVTALVTAALLVTVGVRPATYGDLLSDVASSKVDEVQVVGAPTTLPGERVELRWTVLGGVLDRYAVVQVAEGGRGYDAREGNLSVTSEDPRVALPGLDPDLRITQGSTASDSSFSFMDWRAPGPVVLVALVSWLAVLLLLIGGPEPWRATRWAWFWVWLFTGPLGGLAYLLLGGPLGVGRPRLPTRRLTGGWAFLICVIFLGGASAG